MFVLWNASIRRSVGIVHHNLTDGIFGFVICPVTNEPIIIKYSYPWIVDIFTLSSKRWTEIPCSKPCKSIQFREWSHGRSQVVIGLTASEPYKNYTHLQTMNKYHVERQIFGKLDLRNYGGENVEEEDALGKREKK
ncbi:hypothetical protein Tco_1552511 [Tanacetum coccineum]